jgi:hypothetical protein
MFFYDTRPSEQQRKGTFLRKLNPIASGRAEYIKLKASAGKWVTCRWVERTIRTLADKSPSEHSHEDLAPELRQMIREEPDRIPDSCRQALTLCYLEG